MVSVEPPETMCPEVAQHLVVRAYRELEITGFLTTHQGTGTFITEAKIERSEAEHEEKLDRLVAEFAARAGREGFTIRELRARLKDFAESGAKTK